VAASTITPTVVTPPAPQATPEQQAVLPGNTVSFTSVLFGGDALATGSGLQDDLTNGPCFVSGGSCVTSLTISGEGTWTINQSTGVAQFAADPGATTGTKTPVTYRVTDALGRTATSTLTPVIPPAPTAVADTSVGVVGAQQMSKVVTNDQATSPATIAPGSLALCPEPTPSPITAAACNLTLLTVTGEGTYEVIASGPDAGSLTFVPDPSFTGYATPRPYVVLDSVGQVATATYTPQVVNIPAPVAAPDTTTGLPNATQMTSPVLNDTAGASAYPLDPTTVRLCGQFDTAPVCTELTLTTSDGTFTVNPLTGSISFQPVASLLGAAAPVTYAVTDTAGQHAATSYTPSVVGIGPPQVAPLTVRVAYGTPGTMTPQVTPGTAALDPSKNCLAAPGATCTTGQTSLTRPEGVYVLNPSTGVVTFTPAQGFSGTPSDPPLFCATDVLGQTTCATLTPTVAPPPAPPASSQGDNGQALPGAPSPAALPEVESTMAGQPVTLRPLANDSPSSGAMLDASSVQLRDPRTGRYASAVTIAGQGTFRVNPDGSVVFTPEPGFVGTTPAVVYRVTDSLGKTTTSTVTVIVRDTPPPWADPLFGQAMRGQSVIFDPAAVNTPGTSPFVSSSVRIQDPATGRWATRVVVPGEGTWTVDTSTGKVRFTPLASFTGAATPLNYRMANAVGQKVSSTLNPMIRAKGPALSITTRASHTILRPGQRSLITLRIANQGLATTTRTVTRAPIPKGFAVVNPMGGTVRGGYITFATGNLKPGGGTTRRFVLVATSSGVGQGNQQLIGRATAGNTGPVNDPTALRVIGAVTGKAPVTG
jgi:CshA-type fibril repeat protein